MLYRAIYRLVRSWLEHQSTVTQQLGHYIPETNYIGLTSTKGNPHDRHIMVF